MTEMLAVVKQPELTPAAGQTVNVQKVGLGLIVLLLASDWVAVPLALSEPENDLVTVPPGQFTLAGPTKLAVYVPLFQGCPPASVTEMLTVMLFCARKMGTKNKTMNRTKKQRLIDPSLIVCNLTIPCISK